MVVSLDDTTAESRYALEKSDGETPETLYELNCARQLLAETMRVLEFEYRSKGKLELFNALKPCLRDDDDALPYATIAKSLGKTEEAIKSGVSRLRHQFNLCLRRQIALTVPDADGIEDELRHLRATTRR